MTRREIEINASSVANYLGEFNEKKYPLEEDLSCNLQLYDSPYNEKIMLYRISCNHLTRHLGYVKNIPSQLKSGKFEQYLLDFINLFFKQLP